MIALGYVANFRKKYTVSIKSIYFVNVPSHSAKLKTTSLYCTVEPILPNVMLSIESKVLY